MKSLQILLILLISFVSCSIISLDEGLESQEINGEESPMISLTTIIAECPNTGVMKNFRIVKEANGNYKYNFDCFGSANSTDADPDEVIITGKKIIAKSYTTVDGSIRSFGGYKAQCKPDMALNYFVFNYDRGSKKTTLEYRCVAIKAADVPLQTGTLGPVAFTDSSKLDVFSKFVVGSTQTAEEEKELPMALKGFEFIVEKDDISIKYTTIGLKDMSKIKKRFMASITNFVSNNPQV